MPAYVKSPRDWVVIGVIGIVAVYFTKWTLNKAGINSTLLG